MHSNKQQTAGKQLLITLQPPAIRSTAITSRLPPTQVTEDREDTKGKVTISMRLHYTANRCHQMENFPKSAFQKKPAYSMLNILQASQTFQAARAVCKLTYPSKSSSWPPLNEIWTILDPHLSASHMKFKLQTVHVQKALAYKPTLKLHLDRWQDPQPCLEETALHLTQKHTQTKTQLLNMKENVSALNHCSFFMKKKNKPINRNTPVSCFNRFIRPGC